MIVVVVDKSKQSNDSRDPLSTSVYWNIIDNFEKYKNTTLKSLLEDTTPDVHVKACRMDGVNCKGI